MCFDRYPILSEHLISWNILFVQVDIAYRKRFQNYSFWLAVSDGYSSFFNMVYTCWIQSVKTVIVTSAQFRLMDAGGKMLHEILPRHDNLICAMIWNG